MPPRNIFAYTAPGADFPEFVSINVMNGEIVLTARANEAGGGKQAEVRLPRAELRRLLGALEQEFPSSYADGMADFAALSAEKDGGMAAEAVETLRGARRIAPLDTTISEETKRALAGIDRATAVGL